MSNVAKCAVVDMFGTCLVDEGRIERAFGDAMVKCHEDPDATLPVVRSMMGASKRDVFAACGASRGYDIFKNSLHNQFQMDPPRFIEGVEAALMRLRHAGWLIVILTGLSTKLAEMAWTAAERLYSPPLARLVDIIVPCAAPQESLRPGPDVAPTLFSRPSPLVIWDCVLKAIQGASPEHWRADHVWIAVFGDNPADMQAGCAAGADWTFAVRTGGRSDEELAAVDLERVMIIDNLPEAIDTLLEVSAHA